jgi:hypothetical protein
VIIMKNPSHNEQSNEHHQNGHHQNGHHQNGHHQNGHNQIEPEKIISLDTQETTEPSQASSNPEEAAPKTSATLPLTVAADPEANLSDFYSPDVWSRAAVVAFLVFSLVSISSTFISTHLLITLLSGGATTSIPFLWTKLAISDAVAAMGTGILEGASYSDSYHNYKGNAKKASHVGRFMAFIAQSTLYYMALASLLFQPADMSLGQPLKETDAPPTPALTLGPPSPLHLVFVGSVSVAWSYGTTYLGPDALLLAIASLRRKPDAETDQPDPEPLPEPDDDKANKLDQLKALIEQIMLAVKHHYTSQMQDIRRQEIAEQQAGIMADINAKLATLQNLSDRLPSDEGAAGYIDKVFDEVLGQVPSMIWEDLGTTHEEVRASVQWLSRPPKFPTVVEEPASPSLPKIWFTRS